MSPSYGINTPTNSDDLTTTIIAASTPEQIATACDSIESFLRNRSPDHSRLFFSLTFPTLIRRLFGFDQPKSQNPNTNAWIHNSPSVHHNQLSSKLLNLLSPTGVLMSSITSVDRLSLVKYAFPIERLPEWIRLTLENGTACGDLSDLCPLFKGRLVDGDSLQVRLNVLEYYLFWFAYYPVFKGSCDSHTAASSRVSKRFRLQNWSYKSVPVFGTKPDGSEPDNRDSGSLYIQLLRSYLHYFVPLNDLNVQSPYRSSSLLHYSSSYNTSVLEHAEFFVHTLIHFWIVGNDFSPLPVNLCKSFGVVLPLRHVLAELPPAAGLGEVVNVFVKYLNLGLLQNSVEGRDLAKISKVTTWDGTGSVGYWNSCLQRPLYRYILRTLLFCPVEASVKNVSQAFSLWVNYMEPWAVSLDEISETHANADSLKRDCVKETDIPHPHEYSSSWQGYVLSNYLFYNSLVMHFIGFAHKFIHKDPKVVVEMVSKVLNVLTSSKELVILIQNMDTAFHSSPAGSSTSMANSVYRFVPLIREQLQDWEDGLSETDASGSILHDNWSKDLKLFSTSEDGGQQLLQLLVLRAESELQVTSPEKPSSSLQLVKARMGCLFGANTIASPTTPKCSNQSHHEVFSPRRAGNRPATDTRYKGDWMNRPVSEDEIAWLVNLLVKLSERVNEVLGLKSREMDNVGVGSGPSTWSGDGKEGTSSLGSEAMRLMREHGIRVNLRMLGSKKIVSLIVMVITFSILKRVFSRHFDVV